MIIILHPNSVTKKIILDFGFPYYVCNELKHWKNYDSLWWDEFWWDNYLQNNNKNKLLLLLLLLVINRRDMYLFVGEVGIMCTQLVNQRVIVTFWFLRTPDTEARRNM